MKFTTKEVESFLTTMSMAQKVINEQRNRIDLLNQAVDLFLKDKASDAVALLRQKTKPKEIN